MSSQSDGVVRTQILAASSSWDGVVLPNYPQGVPRVTILRITIAPHAKLAMHRHLMINAGMVLAGELTVVAKSGITAQFKSGEGVIELVDTWHYGENRGDTPVELVMFYAGTTTDESLSELDL
ncbi:MAG: cupin domain-containing protein [Alistipes sp.]